MKEPQYDVLRRWKFKVVYEDGHSNIRYATAQTYEKSVELLEYRLKHVLMQSWQYIQLIGVTSIPEYYTIEQS